MNAVSAMKALRTAWPQSLAYDEQLMLPVDRRGLLQKLQRDVISSLDAKDKEMLEKLRKAVHEQGNAGLRKLELHYAEEGYLVPAILVFVLVLLVYVVGP